VSFPARHSRQTASTGDSPARPPGPEQDASPRGLPAVEAAGGLRCGQFLLHESRQVLPFLEMSPTPPGWSLAAAPPARPVNWRAHLGSPKAAHSVPQPRQARGALPSCGDHPMLPGEAEQIAATTRLLHGWAGEKFDRRQAPERSSCPRPGQVLELVLPAGFSSSAATPCCCRRPLAQSCAGERFRGVR